MHLAVEQGVGGRVASRQGSQEADPYGEVHVPI